MSSPSAFLLRYVLASSVLFTLWTHASLQYTDTLVPAVNVLAQAADIPMQMERRGQHLLYGYHSPSSVVRLEAHDHGAVYLNLVPLLALLAATPGRRPSWYAASALLGSAVLWSTHAVSFLLGGVLAAHQVPAAHAAATAISAAWFTGTGPWAAGVLEQWALWGQYSLCLVLWVVCVSLPLRLPQPAPVRLPLPWRLRPATR